MENTEINFHLESFDGPLDLLLHLISKNKVSIYDIPISLILEQYMEYINMWKKLNLDIAAEFITMASELMYIKSKMLLPKLSPVIEDDPREKLADALIEYKNAKETAQLLGERFKDYHGRMAKEPEEIEKETVLIQHNIGMLSSAFERILRRSRANSEEISQSVAPEKALNTLLSTKVYSITGKIFGIMKKLYRNGDMAFETLMCGYTESRNELVTAFLALLELIRSQRVELICDDGEENGEAIILHLSRNKTDKKST